MSLFTEEERWEMYRSRQAKLNAERRKQLAMMPPTPKTRAEKCEADRRVLLEIVRDNEFPGATVAELATAASRSQSWVRRTLKAAGLTLQPVRGKKAGQP